MLAGNNPSAWESITSDLDQESVNPMLRNRAASRLDRAWNHVYQVFRPTFKTKYRTCWPWARGIVKSMWLTKYVEEYGSEQLREEVLNIGLEGWLVYALAPCLILLILPSFLGAMVRYALKSIKIHAMT